LEILEKKLTKLQKAFLTMEKTYIIGSSQNACKLGFEKIEFPKSNDFEIHKWVLNFFSDKDIDKLIIDLDEDFINSIKIALHIRLSPEYIVNKSLLPIVFVSTSNLNQIISNKETAIWNHILSTKGIYFTNFENVLLELGSVAGLQPHNYKSQFLDIIKILPSERMGRHSLANIWGAYRIDKFAETCALDNNAEFDDNKADLYFKYILAQNFDINKFNPPDLKILGKLSSIPGNKPNRIHSKGKKILLIDDEADKGWEAVLRKVFKTSSHDDFVVLCEKAKDFEDFSENAKNIIINKSFDLYLVDLRLNGLEEEDVNDTESFSGMKVLKKMKELNEGYQVIIFTASNKAWNLKKLIDAGADGYYVKESPEYNFPDEFSNQNYLEFKTEVLKCYERGYLRYIYNDILEMKQKIDTLDIPEKFLNELKNQLNLAFNMILNAKSNEQFAYSYISLYLVIEIVSNQFVLKDPENQKWSIKDIGYLKAWYWDEEGKKYVPYSKDKNNNKITEVIGNKPPEWQKLAGLYFQKWDKKDVSFIQDIYLLINKRNGFIHNDRDILDKKDKQGKLINHDIYKPDGFIKLFDCIKKIINCL